MRPTALLLAALLLAGHATAAPPRLAPWHFQTDFRAGLPAWMSFPLAQDVGYDPTLFTTASSPRPVLVRAVSARGEKLLRVGLIRPLRFTAGLKSRVRLTYRLEACGAASTLRLTLGAADGRRYPAALPAAPGWHTVEVTGRQLQLPRAGAAIQTLVIEARVRAPTLGSENRLTLRSLAITALRPATIAVLAPALAASDGAEVRVARQVAMPVAPLFVRLAGSGAATARLYDPADRLARTLPLPAAGATILPPADAAPGLWRLVAVRPGARASFDFLALPGLPPAHPRLLIGAARWQALRASPPLRGAVRAAARAAAARVRWNAAAGGNIALLSRVSVLAGLPGYFTLLENYSHAIALNALDYQLTGNLAALANARRGLLAVAHWRTWTPPWFAAHGLHTYYEVGVFSQRVAFGYDLIASQLSPGDRATLAGAFWRLAIQPAVQEYFLDNRMPIAASNHMAHAVGGALALAVATAGDTPRWSEREAPAIAELLVAYRRLLRGLFPGGGSEAEPAGYQDFAMIGMSWGGAALAALGIHPPGLRAMEQSYWWPKYTEYSRTADGLHLLDTGDFGGWLSSLSGFAWPAVESSDPGLRAFYASARVSTVAAVEHAVAAVADTGRALEAAPGLLDLACCPPAAGGAAKAAAEAPLARIFPGRGSAALRSGWQPGATVISLRVGPWFNHEHADEGSFQIAARGEQIVGEAGYADYYKEPLYATYFSQAAGHNVVLLDGDPFSQSGLAGRYWRAWSDHPTLTRHAFAPGLDYVAADLAPAYAGRLAKYRREYIFVAPDLLVVRDQLRASEPHAFTWLLHAPPGDAATIAGNAAAILGRRIRATIVADDAVAQWRVIPAPVPEGDFSDLDRPIPPRRTLSLTSAPAASRQFLVGIQIGPAAARGDLQAVRSAAGRGFHAPAAGSWLLFRRGAGELAAGGFATDGGLLAVVPGRALATGARRLRGPGGWRAVASEPIAIFAARSGGALRLRLWAPAAGSVRVRWSGGARQANLAAGENRLDLVF